jgi:uncharacterized protein (TIGR02611 family)
VTSPDQPPSDDGPPTGADRAAPGDRGRSLRQRVAVTRWRRALAARRATHLGYRLVVGIVGTAIVALGLLTIPLPGPGWFTVILGLVVLATEFVWAERLLRFTRARVRRWSDWVAGQALWVRLVLTAATAAFAYGVVVVVLHLTGVPAWTPQWVPLWR